jgi:glycosyltransferase involved in cell wall biosynthesis
LFPGFVEEAELPSLYSAADCVASASTFETQGLSLLEAMACGTPAAAARALAFREEIRDGRNGFLFEPGNASDCAEKILRLVAAGEKKREALSRNARASAERVRAPLVAREWEKAYSSLR